MHRRGGYLTTSQCDAQQIKQLHNVLPRIGDLYEHANRRFCKH